MFTLQNDSVPAKNAKGNPRFFSYFTNALVKMWIVTMLVIVPSIVTYIWEVRKGDDPYPDSKVGLVFAIAGTLFFACAGILYTLQRRSRKRAVGKLHVGLQWHIAFAVMALVLLFLHSFGNFNPRTGTYAMYGMIAMVISGFIGRALDRVVPRLMAQEVQNALTLDGEDRMKTISRKLEDIVEYNAQQAKPVHIQSEGELPLDGLHGNSDGAQNFMDNDPTTWDLAYISLEETPQELSRHEQHYRFVPDKKSALTEPGALIPGAQKQMKAIKEVEVSLQREQFYRYIIRYWRVLHICIALVTLGLTLWHIEYAITLWLPH